MHYQLCVLWVIITDFPLQAVVLIVIGATLGRLWQLFGKKLGEETI